MTADPEKEPDWDALSRAAWLQDQAGLKATNQLSESIRDLSLLMQTMIEELQRQKKPEEKPSRHSLELKIRELKANVSWYKHENEACKEKIRNLEEARKEPPLDKALSQIWGAIHKLRFQVQEMQKEEEKGGDA